jgi:hypothetical protein
MVRTGSVAGDGGSGGLRGDDFDQIDRFLTVVGQGSLLAYYDLDAGTAQDSAESAIQARRRWAQGQQANPKYRVEARWIITHNALIRRVLLDRRAEYVAELARREHEHALGVLDQFLLGILAGGRLPSASEDAVRQRGRALGLPDSLIVGRIDARLAETGAQRTGVQGDAGRAPPVAAPSPEVEASLPPAPTMPGFLDHYRTLGAEASATLSELEVALRARYRWARTIRDPARAAQIYDSLDEAWRVLRDVERRARYDEERQDRLEEGTPSLDLDPAVGLDPGRHGLGQLPGVDFDDEVEEDLPTDVGPMPAVISGHAGARPDPADLLLGPPDYPVEMDSDDLLLGPPASAVPSSASRLRPSGVRSTSSLRSAQLGAGSAGRRPTPGLSEPTEALPREATWPTGLNTSAASRTMSQGRSSPSAGLSGGRSLPPVDSLQEPTRADDAALEFNPSRSWVLYLAGALAVVAVWAVLAMWFGWGKGLRAPTAAEEPVNVVPVEAAVAPGAVAPGADAPVADAPVADAPVADAPVADDPTAAGSAAEPGVASPETPSKTVAGGVPAPDAPPSVLPKTQMPGAGAASGTPPAAPPKAPEASKPTVPTSAADAPAPAGAPTEPSPGSDREPSADAPEAAVATPPAAPEVEDAPDGYMDVPDDFK